MKFKEYEMPDGKKAVFEYDENGVGKITLECMDMLMGLINDRKTEPTSSKMEQVDEPKTQTETQNSNLTFKTLEYCDICDHKGCKECIANALDEHCMPSQFKKQIEDECAKEYEELGLKKLKELIEADRKTEPTQNQHIQSVESVGEDRKTEQTEREGE